MTNVDFTSKIKEKTLLGRGSEWVLITICLQEANNLPGSILLKSQSSGTEIFYILQTTDCGDRDESHTPKEWMGGLLYLKYDIEKPLLPQVKENGAKALGIISGIDDMMKMFGH